MNDLDYYLLQQEEKRRRRGEMPITDEQLMAAAYNPATPIMPDSTIASQPMPQPAPQRIDRETMGIGRPQPAPQPQQRGYNPWPQRIAENRAASAEAWGNFFKTLGPSSRRQPIDYSAPERARSMVRNQYLAEDANRRQDALADLQTQKMRRELQPKPVDEIKRATDFYNMLKAKGEVAKGEREAATAGQESANKQALVDMINSSGKVGENAASMAFSLKTLEQMGKDIGLSELDLKKAKAMGGGNISGKNIAYNPTAQPRLASLVAKAAEGKSKFLGNINDSDAYKEVVNSPDLDAKQKREIIEQQGWDKEIERTQDRLYRYADETLKKISAPENGVASMLKAITDLKEALAKHPDVPGWGEISSAANAFGPLGQWGVDLSQINDPAAKDIMQAVRGYNEAYRRLYSGAAINKDEKADFASQLGAGAFSNPESLKIGVERAERILRNGIWNTFSTIDERVWDEYIPRAKTFLPRERTVSKQDVQAVASKYKVK